MHRSWIYSVLTLASVLSCTQNEAPLPSVGHGDRLAGRSFAGRSPVLARNGMAATAHPLATQIALDILKKGGSAVDAAIAANAALGFLEPVACGIGGDLFALIWDPEQRKVAGFNGSGRAPQGRSLDALRKRLKAGATNEIPPFGSLSVTVPGAVDGWFELHARYGRLPMADVLAPAIKYANEGVPVPQTIAHYWGLNLKRLESFAASEPWLEDLDNARTTYAPGGNPPVEGTVFRNPHLAVTYQKIAEHGRAAFYEGQIAEVIDTYMKRIGGDLSKDDLKAHKGSWVEPLSVEYRGYTVFELPPNTQGLAALQMLAILQGFDLGPAVSTRSIHLQVEAKRLAFEDRARSYADPAFSKIDPTAFLAEDRIQTQRAMISEQKVWTGVALNAPKLEEGDTTYLTVADSSGMMVSLIQSNYRGMGSGLVPDGLGFMLQDRGELFSMSPDHANVYAPGKRPFHTIIPAMVTREGEPWLSFGVMGGGMQPQGHVQILCNLIDFGMNLQEAGDAARWRHDGSPEPTGGVVEGPGVVRVESGIPPAIRSGLKKLGHTVEVRVGGFGGYQAIMRDGSGVYYGATELRKDGAAAGY